MNNDTEMNNTELALAFAEDRSTPEGFRSGEGVDDEIVVRELVQNALDAGADTIHFRVRDVPKSEIPDIKGYRSAVASILPKATETSIGKAALEHIDQALKNDKVTCLLCADNGEGLGIKEYRSLLGTAMSQKTNEASAGKLGSVGVGHLTALDASDLRYVLYLSKQRNRGEPLFGGQTILATQRDPCKSVHRDPQGCLTTSDKVENFRGYEASPGNPDLAPSWLRETLGTCGTTVAILAYGSRNDQDDTEQAETNDTNLVDDPIMDRIFDAVAKHFMVALHKGRIKVTFASDLAPRSVVLDKDAVAQRLALHKEQRRAKKGRRAYGSGYSTWSAYQTITQGELLRCEGASLWFRPTPGESSSVTVFRNGMRITNEAPYLTNFGGYRSFCAVLDAENALATAIKNCETDSHLEISIAKAPAASRKQARDGLKTVQDTLKAAAGLIDTQEWVPEVCRIFTRENNERTIKPAPSPYRPPDENMDELLPFSSDDVDEPAPPGPGPDGPSPGSPNPEPSPEIKPRQWRPGSTEGIRRTFAPLDDKSMAVGWDFIGDSRKPLSVGVAAILGSGSLPADIAPAPDQALWIRQLGDTEGTWMQELKVPASLGAIQIEIRNAPDGWEAVSVRVSRRA